MRLNDLSIRSLAAPPKGYSIHLDDTFKGFGLRVTHNGAKSFVLTYGNERKRVTLGRYPEVSLAEARAAGKRHLAEVTLGQRGQEVSLVALVDQFLAERRQVVRPITLGDYNRFLKRHLYFDTKVSAVTPQKLADIFGKVKKPQERAHLVNVARMLFRFAELRGYVTRSPAIGFTVQPAKTRERVLTPDELRAVWRACGSDRYGVCVKLMILTGQRRREVQYISFNGDIASIPPAHTKNKRAHVFPVTTEAQKLLALPRQFNGWSKAKVRLDTLSGVTGWTLHDLRRTYATTLAELSTPPHIIEAILNHKSGIISGVAATYNRFLYLDEMRQAVQSFEKHLTVVLNAETADAGHEAAEIRDT